MQKLFDILHVKSHPKTIALIALISALILETIEFIFEVRDEGFLYERLFTFIFDALVILFVIFSIIKNNIKVLEISIVVLKTFEGTFYPLIACRRLDRIIASDKVDTFYMVNHILFGVASAFMLIALIIYCVHKFTGTVRSWNLMKLAILIASLVSFISAIMFTIETIRGTVIWEEVIGPYCLALMFFGVYATCEYIEERATHVKKVNIA